MRSLIYHIVVYGVVPGIMLIMFLAGLYVSQRAKTFQYSAYAGLCAGLVCFVIYVVSSFTTFQAPSLVVTTLPSFHIVPIALGTILGFAILLLLNYLRRPSGLVGLFVLFLIASSSISSFSYFFASPLRSFAIYFALGALLGMLLHVILFPDAIRSILRQEQCRLFLDEVHTTHKHYSEEEEFVVGISEVPADLLKLLFNLDHGRHIDTICKNCGEVTDQVIISYELLPLLRDAGIDLALIGRLMDIVPFMPVLVGRPTICRCGTVNR